MRRAGRSRRHHQAIVAAVVASLVSTAGWVVAVPTASAAEPIYVTTVDQEINADADCSLQEAIYSANYDDNIAPDLTSPGNFFETGCTPGSGADQINLLPAGGTFSMYAVVDDPDNYVGPTANPIITSEIYVNGLGAHIRRASGAPLMRAFAVGTNGNLTLREVYVTGFSVHGGNGADGGGGGMGAGGAAYVDEGSLTIDSSTFADNHVAGGNGGFQDTLGGGGGGGLAGNGGNADYYGGGGGGSRGDGGTPYLDLAGAGGGRVTSATNGMAGQPCGALGGESDIFGSDDGDDAGCRGGGGGGGTARVTPQDPFCGGDGGSGAYGAGGGGGGLDGDGGHGGFGGGGGGLGGSGGFGGGGGNDQGCSLTGAYGQGGTFAGSGHRFGGGGGAGLGGALFGYKATIHVVNSTFTGNTALRGKAADEGNDGRAAGGAIFTVAGALTIESSTIAGNETGEFTLDSNGYPVGIGGGGIVVYDPIGSDEATLVLRNTIVANNGPFECYTRNGVTTTGSQGNLITDSRLNVSEDPACPGVVASGDPLLQGLALNPQGRTPTMKIPGNSPAVDKAIAPVPQVDQRLVLRPQGNGSDIGAYEASSIPPVTAIELDPAAPDGSNGWYRQSVGTTLTASDPDGFVAQTRCALDPVTPPAAFADLPDADCSVTSVSGDGAHALYAASVDTDGNMEDPVTSVTFKIDAMAPTLAPSLNVTTVQVGQPGVVASPNASDVTSGVASASCGSVDTSTPGVHTVNCSATDNAGNSATTALVYVVEYRILGFFEPFPYSKWRVGQTVPVKIALGDHLGTRISDDEAASLAADCRVLFSAAGAQSKAAQCLKYDPGMDQFIYPWRLAKRGTGVATISVTVTYPGSSITTVISETVEITR